jgi:predicted enzyme related to lactoylglutathione lyase
MSAANKMAAPAAAHVGKFIWYELMTPDGEAAAKFYTAVIGWTAAAAPPPNSFYTLLSTAGRPIAGLMTMPAELSASGARPGWRGFVGVADVDEATARVKAAGGQIHHEPTDIPDVGRFSAVADPQGAVFMLFRGNMEEPMTPLPPTTPGIVAWHELQADDREAAFAFYAKLFGWTKDQAMDMGADVGVYQLFAQASGSPATGGMLTRLPQVPAPFWQYYIQVENIPAAVTRINKAGGKVINGPHQVPGGTWIVHGIDPQGVYFAIVGAG